MIQHFSMQVLTSFILMLLCYTPIYSMQMPPQQDIIVSIIHTCETIKKMRDQLTKNQKHIAELNRNIYAIVSRQNLSHDTTEESTQSMFLNKNEQELANLPFNLIKQEKLCVEYIQQYLNTTDSITDKDNQTALVNGCNIIENLHALIPHLRKDSLSILMDNEQPIAKFFILVEDIFKKNK